MASDNGMVRGFLLRLEVGRQGLVVARLLKGDGTTADFQVPDLDADPERFNERLSKLGLLRDAMTRGEPVEIQYTADAKSGALVVDRAVRITRDSLGAVKKVASVDGLIGRVEIITSTAAQENAEQSDTAKVSVLTATLDTLQLILDLQVPERHVADQQLQCILGAQQNGNSLRLLYDADTQKIFGVAAGDGQGLSGGEGAKTLDGFVESLALGSSGSASSLLATFRFTTAPAFSGDGNYVPLQGFSPQTVTLYVVKGSPAYELVETGLRQCLRMRVDAVGLTSGRPGAQGDAPASAGNAPGATAGGDAAGKLTVRMASAATGADKPGASEAQWLATGVTLLAPLASASRPVWIKISRESLDQGPECLPCAEGIPSSDLRPRTLRDLRLPYDACWSGWGCFNHGVYRFQFKFDMRFSVEIDGKALCVHAGSGDDKSLQFAHACLHGEHHVKVCLEGWTCDREFVLDVYRLR